MKSVIDRMKENNSEHKIQAFKQKQSLPYEAKLLHAKNLARDFYDQMEGMCYVSVGGLDSITLYIFLRFIGLDVPAVSVSTLEDKSIQKIHKALGIKELKPLKSKIEVIREHGWPVLSKEISRKIDTLQHPTYKNATMRHAIITGETGAYGGYRKNTRMKLPQKWLEKFGGYENEQEGTDYKKPNFKVSDKCCYYLKERPCDIYAKESGRYPYMGLMASEGGATAKNINDKWVQLYIQNNKAQLPVCNF